jgi:Carboxypeptidase regulatory-like domain
MKLSGCWYDPRGIHPHLPGRRTKADNKDIFRGKGLVQELFSRQIGVSVSRFASFVRPTVYDLFFVPFFVLLFAFPSPAQPQQAAPVPEAPRTVASAGEQSAGQQLSGSISGRVVDQTGGVVVGARVTLTRDDQSSKQDLLTDNYGQFSFDATAPGLFHLTISSEGFATQSSSGILHPGEIYIVPQIALPVAAAVTEVQVTPSRTEIAEEQLKDQEKQRVLGFIPNFYVSYIPNAAPLSSKQKFKLAWKTTVDPVTFGLTGAIAGIEQAQNEFKGYGQGAAGYGRRYGASYGDLVTGTFIGSAILPSLLKQDPRYFYKGTGSRRSRILYALANAVVCKGDNENWQANYSGILGGLASGGISNLYYPSGNRGVALTFENALIGLGESAAANLFQEFIVRKFTPNIPSRQPSKS